jgi:hypothetical protein
MKNLRNFTAGRQEDAGRETIKDLSGFSKPQFCI